MLRQQSEHDSQKALAPARSSAASKSERSSSGSAHYLDLSSGSGASQPGALTSLANHASSSYMNVFGYKAPSSEAPTTVAPTTTGYAGSQASSMPYRSLFPVDLYDLVARVLTAFLDGASLSHGGKPQTNAACASQGAAQPYEGVCFPTSVSNTYLSRGKLSPKCLAKFSLQFRCVDKSPCAAEHQGGLDPKRA